MHGDCNELALSSGLVGENSPASFDNSVTVLTEGDARLKRLVDIVQRLLIHEAELPTCQLIPRPLTEQQGAVALGVSTATLRRERKRGRISYTMIAGRPRYTAEHLAAYLKAREVKPRDESNHPAASVRSASTGSVGVPTAPYGAGRGSTPALDKRAEHLSALVTLQPQGPRSCSGSQATLPPHGPPQRTSPSAERSSDTKSAMADTRLEQPPNGLASP
jgi:hypothetical protein